MNQHLHHHIKAFKYFAMALFVLLPFVSFLIGYQYEAGFIDLADPRTRVFSSQEACESFTERVCVPTLCENNPQHASCATNNQTGWFATRQPLRSSNTQPTGFGQELFTSQQECEQMTGASCTYTMCDYIPPGKTVEEVCGSNFTKGWIPMDAELPADTSSKEASCTSNNGTYNAQYNECEGIAKEQCTAANGTFNECASACRHNPDPQAVCIQMCVPVCTF